MEGNIFPCLFSFYGRLIIQTSEAAVQRTLKLQCLTELSGEHPVHAGGLENNKWGGKWNCVREMWSQNKYLKIWHSQPMAVTLNTLKYFGHIDY